MEIKSESLQKTKKAGELLAEEALKTKTSKALVFGLKGDLGSGKTAFTQGFARGLRIRKKILSPTFILMKKFQIPGIKGFKTFYHFDCYRIKNKKEILNLGFKGIISDSQNIVVIEWADKIKGILPENSVSIEFKLIDVETRKISFL